MKIKSFFILLMFLISSCGGYKTAVKETDNKGYLVFSGDLNSIIVLLDDKTELTMSPEVEQYSVNPGQYEIKIYRDNKLIVNRIIIVESQTIYQIEVP